MAHAVQRSIYFYSSAATPPSPTNKTLSHKRQLLPSPDDLLVKIMQECSLKHQLLCASTCRALHKLIPPYTFASLTYTQYMHLPARVLNAWLANTLTPPQEFRSTFCRCNRDTFSTLTHCPSLTALALPSPPLTDLDTFLNEVIQHAHLTSLDVSHSAISDRGLRILSASTCLITLTLNQCPRITNVGLSSFLAKNSTLKDLHLQEDKDLMAHIHWPKFSHLCTLDASGTALSNFSLIELTRTCSSLTSLTLRHCSKIDAEGISTLALNTPIQLCALDFSDNPQLPKEFIGTITHFFSSVVNLKY